ncbi:MAG: hypothetical protein ABIJ97_10205 [Bacteroidota bacterium]
MMYRYKLLLLSVLFSTSVFSQLTSFPNESDKFFKEMNSFLQKYDKEKSKPVMDELEPYWIGQTFDETQKKIIYTTCNRMLEKRCNAFPHFFNYMSTLLAYCKYVPEKESYSNWNKGLNTLLKEKKTTLRSIELYIGVAKELWTDNTIFKSATTQWKVLTRNHKYIIDGDNAKILVEKTNLICYAKRDSIIINETSGLFDPITSNWKGINGKVTWERAGYNENEVFAILSKYKIDMKKSEYQADSVVFVNTEYFNEPLMGNLIDKVTVSSEGEKTSYPQFESFTKRFQIKNIYENIDYDGGFTMKGERFIGSGNDQQDAFLNIYKNDTLFLRMASKMYIFYKDKINSDRAKATFYLIEDSIFHPGLTFNYNVESKIITLLRSRKDISRSPFYDTFHGLEIDVSQFVWKMGEPIIRMEDLKSIEGSNEGTFESIDFYRQDRYFQIQGQDEQNPLVVVRNYTKKYGTEEFTTDQLANFLPASIPQTRHFLMSLSYQGFISYDAENDKAYVLPKLYNYIQSSIGKRDYDVITFSSSTNNKENAQLSLLNYNLKINGVPEIFLSDSQNVAIFPDNQEVILKKNRDFEFNGKIRAGYFLFVGSNFKFSYDKFKIDLTDVEYVRMRVPSHILDKNGMPEYVFVQNKLENITGNLLIDAPNNKSGMIPNPDYPIFNSEKNSYVYYDDLAVQSGVYKRDIFYFQIYPFSMNNLDNMKKDELLFKGYFVSGGIFPPFEDTLRLMPDYSLGLIRKAPEGGYPLYGGKGTFENDIVLSNEGLKGNGVLNYITSTTTSDNLIFFPDSMNALAQSFVVKEQKSGVEFPEVNGSEIYVHWMPYKDILEASDRKDPVAMYNGQAKMHGTLLVTPAGLGGHGMNEFENAQLFSNDFSFNNSTIDADTSKFNLKSLDSENLSFKTDNVNAHIDFKARTGKFTSNGAASFVEFPENQYICYMDQFTWYMDREEIEMSASKDALANLPANTENLSPSELEDIQLEGSEFISVHPRQDSLKFVAPSAKYNLRKKIITADKVKFIRVADATVYPSDGVVVIEKKASMKTLVNSKIIANTTTRFHSFYNATTNIYGKKDYTSSGDYDFIDETGAKQTIHFGVIGVDSTVQTYATGNIGIVDGFTISPYFEYTGKVKILASQENMYYDGSIKMKHECPKALPAWIQFNAQIDPKEIYIPIDSNPKDINNNDLHASFMITNDSAHIYPAFLNRHETYSDTEMLPVSGFLHFDKQSGKYKISHKEKLVEYKLPGPYMSIHRTACNIFGEGKMSLGVDFGQIKQISAGSINYDMSTDDADIELLYALDFFFNDKCLEMMAAAINTSQGNPVDFSRDIYSKSLMEIVGEQNTNEFLANLSLGNFKKFPKELEKSIVFSELKLKFDPLTKTYNSVGTLGISNILKTQLHKHVNGHVQIIKKRSGDKIILYMELDEVNWYYFEYNNGVMRVVSTNELFNNTIKEMKPEDRKLNVEKGEAQFTYYPSPSTIVKKFLKQFQEEDDSDVEDPNNEEEIKDENF